MKIIVMAKPAARENKIEKIDETTYRVSITEPPVQGKANVAIIKALAGYFNVSPSQVQIVQGHTARRKIIDIAG